jgi:chromosome segregation ATPase
MTTTDLAKAQATVAELTRKYDAVVERWENLTSERSAISFAALAENDAQAKKRLDVINSEGSRINQELASIDAAIKTAKERVEQAETNEQRAEARSTALAAQANSRWLVDNGPKLSHHAQALAALLEEVPNEEVRKNRSQFQAVISDTIDRTKVRMHIGSNGRSRAKRPPRPTSGQAMPRRRSCRASSTICMVESGGSRLATWS